MTALLYIFPVLFLALAIGAFFIDVDGPKGKFIFIGMAVVLLIMLGGNEFAVFTHIKEKNALEQQTDQIDHWKTGQIARMNTLIASMSAKTETQKQKLSHLTRLGWSADNPIIQEAYLADEARQELIEYMPNANHPAVIENLPHYVDKMLLTFALEEMGFVVRANQTQDDYLAQEETAEDQSDDAELADETASGETKETEKVQRKQPEINAIFYGHLVRNNDIKLVMYTLLRAGIPIKYARVMRDKTNENARNIKFVYSKSYDKRSAYDVNKIKRTKLFKR